MTALILYRILYFCIKFNTDIEVVLNKWMNTIKQDMADTRKNGRNNDKNVGTIINRRCVDNKWG